MIRATLATIATLLLATSASGQVLEEIVSIAWAGHPQAIQVDGFVSPLGSPIGPWTFSILGAEVTSTIDGSYDGFSGSCQMHQPDDAARVAQCDWSWWFIAQEDAYYIMTGNITAADAVPHQASLWIGAKYLPEFLPGVDLGGSSSGSSQTISPDLTLGRTDGEFNSPGQRFGVLQAGEYYQIEGGATYNFSADLGGGDALATWNVELIPVPEPSRMAMLVPGVLTLGAMARRRQH